MIYSREKLERFEDLALAPYGIRSKDSKGREYPEQERGYRTIFRSCFAYNCISEVEAQDPGFHSYRRRLLPNTPYPHP